ncbi:hypothetical protein VCSRO98_0455 [Vibrio cholerae]|uniref:DUF3187 family protein n=1 Tax=Vibrio cholerae TaxID=666 RepID=UPI0011DAB9EE|nr:DUF3187 family protein [Vibrio cholerae]TXY81037.1 DUF3187 family protein [Vibrio cholerae]GIC09156.1 hypothetical protein VCSRO98_0455 [Vibrio cholerae]
MRFILLLSLICTLVAFPSLANEYRYGPFINYAQAPLASHSLTPQLRDGFSLPLDSQELFGGFSAASIWSDSPGYEGDFYQNQFTLGLKWQFAPRWQAELSYRFSQAWDNQLDSLTMGFHDLFGLDQNGRDSVDKHRFHIAVPEHKIAWDDFSGSTLSSAFSVYTQYQIHTSEQHGLSLGATLYYNQNGLLRLNRFEQALQLNYTYQQDAHRIYGLLGVVHHNSATGTLPTKKSTLTLAAGYEYQLNTKHHLFSSFHFYQDTVESPKELEKPATEYVLGYRYVMPSSALELALTENVFSTDNSTDIALHISYRYRL